MVIKVASRVPDDDEDEVIEPPKKVKKPQPKKKERQPWVGVIDEPQEEDEEPEQKPVAISWPSSKPTEVELKQPAPEEKKTAED